MSDTPKDTPVRPRLTGKASLCRACGKVFSTTSNFDKHRVGKYDVAAPGYGRRCLTTAELEVRGMAVNNRGRWSTPGRPPRLTRVAQGAAIGTGPLPLPGGGA